MTTLEKIKPIVGWYERSWMPRTEYEFQPGLYEFPETINWAEFGIRLIGRGEVILRYTGTAATAILFEQPPGASPERARIHMENFIIEAPLVAQNAMKINNVHRSKWIDIRFRNVPVACLATVFSVLNEFYSVTASVNDGAMTPTPSNGVFIGAEGGSSQVNTFYHLVIEGMKSHAIYLRGVATTFIGGTSEGNAGAGLVVMSGASKTTIVGMDFEANGGGNVQNWGGEQPTLINTVLSA